MRSISHITVVHSTGGGTCPEQHWGWLITGEEFYLRYRHGQASLHIGPHDCDWPNLPDYGWGLCRAGMQVSDDEYEGDFRSERELVETFEVLLAELRPGWLLQTARDAGHEPILSPFVEMAGAQT